VLTSSQSSSVMAVATDATVASASAHAVARMLHTDPTADSHTPTRQTECEGERGAASGPGEAELAHAKSETRRRGCGADKGPGQRPTACLGRVCAVLLTLNIVLLVCEGCKTSDRRTTGCVTTATSEVCRERAMVHLAGHQLACGKQVTPANCEFNPL
jgi:hypothetical protein